MRPVPLAAMSLLTCTSCTWGAVDPVPDPPREDVVLVILDTVRADHTSLCGYGRPTTPTLQRLVREGATFTCDGRSPASWTLPSHATYFTGQTIPEHHFDSMVRPDWSGTSTLADLFAARGYATALVTANPVLTTVPGLTQGFQSVIAARQISQWRGGMLARHARAAVHAVPKDQPLFLVVNIMDAHDPYPAVPDGQPWVAAQEALDFKVHEASEAHEYHRFMRGEMTTSESATWVRSVTNGYDWGIHQADDSLGQLLTMLARERRTGRGARIVITSDHGEFLGEHGLVRHGGWLWEPVMAVPLVVVDTRPDHPPPPIPAGPFAMATVFDLTLEGALPATARPVVAFSSPTADGVNHGTHGVAMWGADGQKLSWTSGVPISAGRLDRYLLATDPDEAAPLPADPASPLTAATEQQVHAYRSHVGWRNAHREGPADVAALRALGYVAPEPTPAGAAP